MGDELRAATTTSCLRTEHAGNVHGIPAIAVLSNKVIISLIVTVKPDAGIVEDILYQAIGLVAGQILRDGPAPPDNVFFKMTHFAYHGV